MTVEQISVFVENKAGTLAEVTKEFFDHGIDMRALNIAETTDFGVLRAIVNDTEKAASVLAEAGYIYSVTRVLAVAIPDEAGSLYKILDLLKSNDIDLEYTYAFITRDKETAYMIFKVKDNEKAIELLQKNNIRLVKQDELHRL